MVVEEAEGVLPEVRATVHQGEEAEGEEQKELAVRYCVSAIKVYCFPFRDTIAAKRLAFGQEAAEPVVQEVRD